MCWGVRRGKGRYGRCVGSVEKLGKVWGMGGRFVHRRRLAGQGAPPPRLCHCPLGFSSGIALSGSVLRLNHELNLTTSLSTHRN